MAYYYCQTSAENATVYLGRHAGDHTMQHIENAQSSIKIISPYLSKELVGSLIRKAQQGVNVCLITSDARASRFDPTGQGKAIYQLLTQYRFTDEKAKADKQQKIRLYQLLTILFIVLICISLLLIPSIKTKISVAALCLLLALIFNSKVKEAEKLPIYHYNYYTKLRFKIIKQDRLFHRFFHLKAYVIDGETAYLGSLNFTKSGFEDNIESCVTVTGNAAQAINQYIDGIYHSIDIPFYSEQEILHTYFSEKPY